MAMTREGQKADQPDLKEEQRNLLFLSHANPEDNEFAKWLATQLASTGFAVWCDVTELLGGEVFWDDITDAIESYTAKFLFISTVDSNQKDGTLRELKTAIDTANERNLKDFIVPLKIDSFPYASTHQDIRDRNFIRFNENWSDGLSQLFDLLDREKVPKSKLAGPSCVTTWYRSTKDDSRKVVVTNEICHSNWFSLKLPSRLNIHETPISADILSTQSAAIRVPHRMHGSSILAFAPANEISNSVKHGLEIKNTRSISLETFIEQGVESLNLKPIDANNIVTDMMRQAWELALIEQELLSYELASGLKAWYFKKGHLEKERAYYTPPWGYSGNRKPYRQLVGNRSKRNSESVLIPDGHWHYAVSASPQLKPSPKIILRHHVIFTDDGETPWSNSARMHSARRSACKNWWNDKWRDLLLAFCSAIGDGKETLSLTASEGETFELSLKPTKFVSPWSYYEEGREPELIDDNLLIVEESNDAVEPHGECFEDE